MPIVKPFRVGVGTATYRWITARDLILRNEGFEVGLKFRSVHGSMGRVAILAEKPPGNEARRVLNDSQ